MSDCYVWLKGGASPGVCTELLGIRSCFVYLTIQDCLLHSVSDMFEWSKICADLCCYIQWVWGLKCRLSNHTCDRCSSNCTNQILALYCALDRGYGTCEVDWSKANYSTIHKSYIISILIFCFFIPVMIMLCSYISIINTVKSTNAMAADGLLTTRQRKVERDVTRVGDREKYLLEIRLKGLFYLKSPSN